MKAQISIGIFYSGDPLRVLRSPDLENYEISDHSTTAAPRFLFQLLA